MPTFQSKTYKPSAIAAAYRANLNRHPFLLFGLPFVFSIVAGSFFLTPAAALRYERHDRKVQQMSREEALSVKQKGNSGEGKRKPWDLNEEYYRLQAKDLDDWEQRRVKRLKGETDGIMK